MVIEAYKIYPAWNNAASLVNVENITPSPAPTKYLNDIANGNYAANTSYMVMSTPILKNFVPTPGGSIQNGRTRIDWIFALISDDALAYWITTYTGQMTIATKTSWTYDTYTNWNAIVEPPEVTIEQRFYECDVFWYTDVVVPIYLIGAAS